MEKVKKAKILRLPTARTQKTADKVFWLVLAATALLKAYTHKEMWGGAKGALAEYYAQLSDLGKLISTGIYSHADRPIAFIADATVVCRFINRPGFLVTVAALLVTGMAYLLCAIFEKSGYRFGAAGACALTLSGILWRDVFEISLFAIILGLFFAVLSAFFLVSAITRITKEEKGAGICLTLFFFINLLSMGFGTKTAVATLLLAAMVTMMNFAILSKTTRTYLISAIAFNGVLGAAYYLNAIRLGFTEGGFSAAVRAFTSQLDVFNLVGLYGGSTWAFIIVLPLCGLLFYGLAAEKLFVWETFGVAVRGQYKEIIKRTAAGAILALLPFVPTMFGADVSVFTITPMFFETGKAMFGVFAVSAAQIGVAILYDAVLDALSLIRFKAGGRTVSLWPIKPLGAAAIVLISFYSLG